MWCLGEQWQNLRTNLTSDLTSSKTISSYLPELENIADDFCHLLKTTRNSKSQVLHVEELASRLGLETICCLVLGRRMGFLLNKEINVRPPSNWSNEARRRRFYSVLVLIIVHECWHRKKSSVVVGYFGVWCHSWWHWSWCK